jgi:serine/threonine protein kinase
LDFDEVLLCACSMRLTTPTFIGRYEILAEIGRGSMGVVYKAHDPKIDRIVAIKTILLFDLDRAEEDEQRERFYEEARAVGRLSHPGIVAIFDVARNPENAKPYIVMEYVDSKPLNELLTDNDGRLPMVLALRLAQEIAEALHFAHSQGVVHRDIKPENILMTPEGRPKVADFGIARLDCGHLTVPGRMLGSPAYMSPEQLEGESLDARSDLFSLGVVLYTMLTGHRPFQGNSTATVCFKLANRDPLPVSSWNLDFPLELDELVGRAMAKDPAKRFQTAREMAEELQKFREAHESTTQPLSGIMRIIGQETLPVLDNSVSEHDSDPGSLHDVVSKALGRQKEERPAVKRAEISTVSVRQRAKPATAAPPQKESSRSRAFVAPRMSLLKAGAVAFVVLLVIAGLPFWAKRKHLGEDGSVSASRATRTAEPTNEAVSAQSNVADDSTASSKVKQEASPSADALAIGRREKREQSPIRHKSPIAHSEEPPRVQNRLPLTSKAVVSQNLNSSNDMTDVSDSEKPVTVQMVHLSDLNVVIEHSFQEATASISVDNRPVYAEDLRGEKKRRALIFTRTQGRQSGIINLLPGKHSIVVRVKSANDAYDASQTITQGFSPGSNNTLLVKCDKRKNKLELSIR